LTKVKDRSLLESKKAMGNASTYWHLVRLDSSGRNRVESIFSAKTFFQQHFGNPLERERISDELVQSELLQLIKETGEDLGETERSSLAKLCLRCFISHIIEQVCVQLETQFGTQHGFTRYDLFPFVLDESLPSWRGGTRSSNKVYKSLTSEILQTFNPTQGSLVTWTARLVRQHRELNVFLLECGVYLVSDWAILNDTNVNQLQRILSEFHTLTSSEISRASLLLQSYHVVYRSDRLKKRQGGMRGRCQKPTVEQLQRIAQKFSTLAISTQISFPAMTAREILTELQTLAERLRQYRICTRGGPPPHRSWEQIEKVQSQLPQLATTDSNWLEGDEESDFLSFYRQLFSFCLDRAISQVTEEYITRLQKLNGLKAIQFIKALYLFYCKRQSMTDIAREIGLKAQYQVSRLLKLKNLRADIRRRLLLQLRDRVLTRAKLYVDSERLQFLDSQIEAALEEQIMAIVKEEAAETSINKNRPTRSLYARRLCHYLDTRSLNL
jgi:hypothetical protein